ncbi:MAG: hypothetical protein MI867_05525, partial [Pseudomonadales bacterium]|nr:hypothetical protein [Pseudomonadales bacterium]
LSIPEINAMQFGHEFSHTVLGCQSTPEATPVIFQGLDVAGEFCLERPAQESRQTIHIVDIAFATNLKF